MPCYLDIETVPDYEYLETLDKSIIERFYPQPKYGNTKDPVKREIIAKTWEESGGMIKGLSVDPRWCKPVVVCTSSLQDFDPCIWDLLDNSTYLINLIENIRKNLPLVTHNGKSFDIPVLRAWTVKLGKPDIAKQFDFFLTNPYQHGVHLDFMLWWEQRYGQKFAGLDCIAHQLDIPTGKYGSGADVYGWYQAGEMDKIFKHCQHDVQMLAECCIKEGAV